MVAPQSAEITLQQIKELLGAPISTLARSVDNPTIDAFGRARVSNPVTIFDSKQIFDNQPLFWDERLESGGGISSAHSVNTASTVITSNLNTAGLFTRQTFQRFNYQPGKSQQVVMTGILRKSGGGAGVQARLGIFDDENGLFFEDDAGTLKVVRRSFVTGAAVDDKVAQANWNLDRMDGSGASRVVIDWTLSQLFTIDFEWLAVGRIRLGVIIAGMTIYVHQFLFANVLNVAYMSTPNLPLRFQLETQNPSAVSSIECICTTVISEGGRTDLGILGRVSTDGAHVVCATQDTLYAIVGVRLKTTHFGADIGLRGSSFLEIVGSKNIEWKLIWNPDIAGGGGTWTNRADSAVQTLVGVAANVVTNGIVIDGGHFNSGGQQAGRAGFASAELENALRLGSSISGVPDEVVIAIQPIGGSTDAQIEGGLTWREIP